MFGCAFAINCDKSGFCFVLFCFFKVSRTEKITEAQVHGQNVLNTISTLIRMVESLYLYILTVRLLYPSYLRLNC